MTHLNTELDMHVTVDLSSLDAELSANDQRLLQLQVGAEQVRLLTTLCQDNQEHVEGSQPPPPWIVPLVLRKEIIARVENPRPVVRIVKQEARRASRDLRRMEWRVFQLRAVRALRRAPRAVGGALVGAWQGAVRLFRRTK
jgi:hypothetical protein